MESITEANTILCCFLSLVKESFEIVTVNVKSNTDYVWLLDIALSIYCLS